MLQADDCHTYVTILREGVAEQSPSLCLLQNPANNYPAGNPQAAAAIRPYSATVSTAGVSSAVVDSPPAMA